VGGEGVTVEPEYLSDDMLNEWHSYEENQCHTVTGSRSVELMLLAELVARRKQIAAIRALHREIRWDDNGTKRHECADCEQPWPCPTIRILDGEDR
jgi:hypothetical protein